MIDISTGGEMTRRNFVKGGLAAVIASGCAPALVGPANASVRHGLGARLAANFGGGKAKHTIYDYVGWDDGSLKFFFDAEHNRGAGNPFDITSSDAYDMASGSTASTYYGISPFSYSSDMGVQLGNKTFNNSATLNKFVDGSYDAVSEDGLLMQALDSTNNSAPRVFSSSDFFKMSNNRSADSYNLALAFGVAQWVLTDQTPYGKKLGFAITANTYGFSCYGNGIFKGSKNVDVSSYFSMGGSMNVSINWRPPSNLKGSRIYTIRLYSRELTAEEIAWNHQLDIERYGA